jgi:hypothetical protein
MMPNVPYEVRAYIYRVLLALSAVAVGLGWLTDSEVALWLGVASAILGNGLATRYTERL